MIPISETASFIAIMILNLLLVGIFISAGVAIALKLTRSAAPRMRYLLVVSSFLAAAVVPFVIALIPAQNAGTPAIVEKSNTDVIDNHSARLDPGTTDPRIHTN